MFRPANERGHAPSETCNERNVINHEAEEIALRRERAGVADAAANQPGSESLVGVSLSGGGIRAASVGLGFLQAIYERGLLRYVDYLSTVSGGTFVGAFFSSLVNNDSARLDKLSPQTGNDTSPRPGTNDASGYRFESDRRGRQPDEVQRLIHSGLYLNQLTAFLNGYLIGVLAINLVVWSGIISLCALTAWCLRSLDYIEVQHVVSALGFRGDLGRAFLPMTFLFIAWVVAWAITYLYSTLWSNRPPTFRIARWLLAATFASGCLAIGMLVFTGDISDAVLKQDFGISLSDEWKRRLQKFFEYLFFAVLLTAILPYLRFWELMKSGRSDAPPRHRAVFFVATRALFWGAPLLVFSLFASENISQRNAKLIEEARFAQVNIDPPAWKTFGYRVRQYGGLKGVTIGNGAGQDTPSPRAYAVSEIEAALADDKVREYLVFLVAPNEFLWNATLGEKDIQHRPIKSKQLNEANIPHLEHRLMQVVYDTTELEKLDAEVWFYRRWYDAVKDHWDWHGTDNKYRDLLKLRQKIDANREELAFRINERVLNNIEFSKLFLAVPETPKEIEGGNLKPALAKLRGTMPAIKQIEQFVKEANTESEEAKAAGTSYLNFNEWQHRMTELRRDLLAAQKANDMEAIAEAEQALKNIEDYTNRFDAKAKINSTMGAVHYARLDKYLRRFNHGLFMDFYGKDLIRPLEVKFARNLIEADQQVRWDWFRGAGFVFLVSALVVNLNVVSLFTFFRDQLAKMWFIEPRSNRRLARLQNCERRAPYHLINTTINFWRQSEERFLGDGKDNREPCGNFLLSKLYCGCERLGYVPTEHYDDRLDLATATAISGAALSPTVSQNYVVQAVLFLFNFRLGQWLPNPRIARARSDRPWYHLAWSRRTPLHLLINHFFVPRKKHDFCFLSDGGIYDNLGLEALIVRRCRLMISLDASADPSSHFSNLAQVLRRMEDKLGIRVEALDQELNLGLDRLTPAGINEQDAKTAALPERKLGTSPIHAFPYAGRLTKDHYAAWRVIYPDRSEPAWLIYVKTTVNGDEPEQLLRYFRANEQFPHDSTLDQFYDAVKFEAYRDLGYHLGQDLVEKIFPCLAAETLEEGETLVVDAACAPPANARELCEALENALGLQPPDSADASSTESSTESPPANMPEPIPAQGITSVVVEIEHPRPRTQDKRRFFHPRFPTVVNQPDPAPPDAEASQFRRILEILETNKTRQKRLEAATQLQALLARLKDARIACPESWADKIISLHTDEKGQTQVKQALGCAVDFLKTEWHLPKRPTGLAKPADSGQHA